MELLVRRRRPDEVEQEITQRDQFNTDTVGLVEALVREAHQNSMDGKSDSHKGAVRTRLSIVESRAVDAPFWAALLSPLQPHLDACGIKVGGLDLSCPRLLLIEDFGTTGLLGSVDKRDERNFSDFWRRTGRSHKGGQQGGRWGLGKLVFSSSSEARTFFGLTIQDDDMHRTRLLMGQSALRTHALPNAPDVEYAPHAFFAVPGVDGIQIPEQDADFIATFVQATGIRRTSEPGLSIVIPFARSEINTEQMLPHVIRNWFFPILTGSLEVEVGDVVLNGDNFADHARIHGGSEFADGRRVGFIKALYDAKGAAPAVTLGASWATEGRVSFERSLPADALNALRADYASGALVAVRAPLKIRPQSGPLVESYVDLYLQSSVESARGEAFYVRGAITIPGEAKRFRGRSCFGALVASHHVVAAFLGDAEGPAHTTWSGTAEKLCDNWKAPSKRLKEIREALNWLYQAAANVADHVDPNALLSVFNVPHSGGTASPKKRRDPVAIDHPVGPIQRRPQLVQVDARKGGFVLRGTKALNAPMTLRVRTAYDIIEGNALAQHSPLDFDLMGDDDIRLAINGASATAVSPNELRIDVDSSDFTASLSGFDFNRDLYVSVEGDR